MMTKFTRIMAIAAAGLCAAACSLAELEQFNADLADVDMVYEDMGPVEQRLPCSTRGGHLVAVSSITNNRASLNVVNRGSRTASVEVLVAGEVIRSWTLSPRARSETFTHSPLLTIEFSTSC